MKRGSLLAKLGEANIHATVEEAVAAAEAANALSTPDSGRDSSSSQDALEKSLKADGSGLLAEPAS